MFFLFISSIYQKANFSPFGGFNFETFPRVETQNHGSLFQTSLP